MDKSDLNPAVQEECVEADLAETPDKEKSRTQSFICGPEATAAAYSQLLGDRKGSNSEKRFAWVTQGVGLFGESWTCRNGRRGPDCPAAREPHHPGSTNGPYERG